jgi:hypothetical protein
MLIAMLGLMTAFGAAAQERLHRYVDAETGVSFDYSAAWRPLDAAKDVHYLRPAIQPTRAAVVLDVSPAAYPGTDFAGLSFNYAIAPAANAAACAAAITMYGDAAVRPAVTINGRKFAAAEGGDAAMSHQMYERLYSTFANNRCYVFDLALTTAGFGAADNVRQMNEYEREDAQHALDVIFGTVRIAATSK